MAVIDIEVIHDFVCAWCYIGKRNLDRAIALHRKVQPGGRSDIFNIKWRPYYLNYNPHPHSVEKSELVETRLADMTPEQRTALFIRMDRVGRAVGIHFKAGGKIGSTQNAHRLVHLAAAEPDSQGTTNDLVEKIFEAYHELERDISDPDVLVDLAGNVGIDRVKAQQWLSMDMATDVVDEEARQNKDVLKSGVPVYIVQGEDRVEGSGDISEFLELFAKAKEGQAQE